MSNSLSKTIQSTNVITYRKNNVS